MGTRSTYRVIEKFRENGKVIDDKIMLMYVQYDGYPDGHPKDTAEWLASGRVVNGIGMNDNGLIFNGAGCLAAQLVARFKTGAGGAYLYPMKHRGNSGEDYLYDIIVDSATHEIEFIAYSCGYKRHRIIFKGYPIDFVRFATKKEKELV